MIQEPDYQLLHTSLLEPHTGKALVIEKGHTLRVTDIQGGQVVDFVSYHQNDLSEYLSSPRTIDYNNKIFFSKGDILYSNQGNPMWTITQDSVGQHCFLFAPCDQRMFEITYEVTGPHPNCMDNLSVNLSPYGIAPSQIFIPLNIFMHIEISSQGDIAIEPPLSGPGDYIDLRAEQDLLVGISACSAYKSNAYKFSQIQIEVYAGEK